LGPLFPQIDAGGGVTRERFSAEGLGSPVGAGTFTLYNASVQGTYLFDIWGGTRRQVEAAAAGEDFAQFELEGTYLTLTSNIVTGAIQEASSRAQIAATDDIIKSQTQQLNVLDEQFNLGAVSQVDVLSQQAAVAQTKATLPVLQRQLAATRNHLSILLGRFPAEGAIDAFDLASLTLPQDIPLSVPSKLVEQRPDIRAAEAQLHQASAEVGVATAALFPQITLSASYGGQSTSAGSLFASPNIAWSLGASVLQAIFHGGSLWHARGAAKAAFDKAYADYRTAVLAAFEDVANSLLALKYDAEALTADLAAERAAAGRLRLTEEQFQAGAVAYLSVLDAERTEQQARITLVQAQAARFADTAALFHALGGGWWNKPAPTGEAKS
jgi:NodT family efflux transporter outer membrane factor (OMF) lipoprotein